MSNFVSHLCNCAPLRFIFGSVQGWRDVGLHQLQVYLFSKRFLCDFISLIGVGVYFFQTQVCCWRNSKTQ